MRTLSNETLEEVKRGRVVAYDLVGCGLVALYCPLYGIIYTVNIWFME